MALPNPQYTRLRLSDRLQQSRINVGNNAQVNNLTITSSSGVRSLLNIRDRNTLDRAEALARSGQAMHSIELTKSASSPEAQRQIRTGLDATFLSHALAAAQQGQLNQAIELTGYASSTMVRQQMRASLDAVILDHALATAQQGQLNQAINITGFASTDEARQEMRLIMDPVILDHAKAAADSGQVDRARELTAFAASEASRQEMLSTLEGNTQPDTADSRTRSGHRSTTPTPARQFRDTSTFDIADGESRVNAMTAVASPAARKVLNSYKLETIVALDKMLEDVELQNMAAGQDERGVEQQTVDSDTLIDMATNVLTEHGYEPTTADAMRVVYTLESVRADLGGRALSGPTVDL